MIDFESRLARLKNRRQGTAERDRLEKGYYQLSGDFRSTEGYEKIHENTAIKYVIGAMAPVSSDSTRISREEGERVATTLIKMLDTAGIRTEMRMQGSVALDIHIEGYSDVDMLILKSDIITIEGPPILGVNYQDATDKRPMVEIIRELRISCEEKLTSRYHAAEVNINGSKSISLNGGSLKRKVDIVPSCWHDSHEYQRSSQEYLRTVKILDKKNNILVKNRPFLHIERVNDRDRQCNGNLKKVIRLMKNIVADMPDYRKSTAKKLTSFDIAAIAYSMENMLYCNPYLPLTLLENLRSYILIIAYLDERRTGLLVPDESREIFNSPEKVEALMILEKEVSDLAESVQKILNPLQERYDGNVLKLKQVTFF